MNKSLKNAMHVSRGIINNAQSLKNVLDAEKVMARMSLAEFEEMYRRSDANPADGFLALWAGLYLAATGRHVEGCEKFMQASQAGCAHWRVGWYLAQAAKECGNLPLVDEACRAVLEANPEFWFARELPKHARGYYAQGDHDKSIESFFQQHPPRSKVFVEVGAFDGVHYSNVRRLVEKHGWSGISIEPVGKNFAKLEASYRGSDVRCVRACASDTDGEVELNVSTYPHLPDWGSDVASVSGEDKERWQKQYGAVWTKEKVPALRLTSILDEAGVTDVDLLSIDSEGHDFEVLKGLDFSRFNPQLIVVEYGKHREAILNFLTEQGYTLASDNKQDLFMARPSSSPANSNLDRFTPKERERILAAVNCHDCDDVPKVAHAGEVLPGDPPVQIMHNGVKILEGSYHGDWMTEIIRRLQGHHEPQEEKVFHEVLKTLPPGAVMIEAGSFWAYYSMWFHKAVPGAQNHLIEPNREKFQLSQRHFELNHMKGAFTNGFIGRDSRPNSVFTDWDNRRYRLPQIAIDDYVRQHGIDFLHVLHADIQGAELDLLHGCQESIAQNKIGYIILSTHGDRHPACLEFLTQHGFRVVAQHTIAEGAAADGLIVACSPAMAGLGAVTISKRSLPAVPASSEPRLVSEEEIPGALQKLNPHLLALKVLPIAAGVRMGVIDPLRLVTPERFDILAKHLYARHRALGVESGWAQELYHQHIRAFSNGTCREGDGRKNGIEDYIRSFDETLDSVGAKGFDAQETLVPIGRNNVVIDGAHRVAACLFHRRPVTGLFFDFQPNSYGGDYFSKRGLPENHCDAIALEYCRLKRNTYIVTVFPSAQGRNNEVLAILNGLGRVVYAKHVTLTRQGSLNLIKQIYVGEKWLGDWSNNFGGAAGKADPCFRQPGPVRVFVFETDSMESVREAKTRIRSLFGIENHSVHINDTHEQTIYLGQVLLNENSIHFLNHARPRHLQRFHQHLALYAQMLVERRLNPEHFCVDGSSVMAAYGIRDAQDLDFLHFGCDELQTGNRDLSSHNSEVHHHVATRDDIIFNPDNHFYYFGIKFASLDIIRKLKVERNEGKDQKDVAAIDKLLGVSSAQASPTRILSLDVAPLPDFNFKVTKPGAKIVALVPARNEGAKIAFCFRALARVVDAIVYLDDCSDDDTVSIVESIAAECRVERIIRKPTWHRDEPGDRNALLRAGREIGGTHFAVIDADEAFTANCADGEFLRRRIFALAPGDQLVLTWIQLWRSVTQYRFDGSVWTGNAKPFVFCDDGKCAYSSEFIHTPRVPANLSGRQHKIDGYTHGLLHFQFVNWRNLLIKQAWYRCLEHIREPQKPVAEINQRYAPSKDETGLGLKASPAEWLAGYPFFDQAVFDEPDQWRVKQVLGWFEQHGRARFESLDIWDINWGGVATSEKLPSLPPVITKSPASALRNGVATSQSPDGDDDLAQGFIELAEQCFNRGDVSAARDHLERAADVAPERAQLHVALADLEFQLNRPEQARGHLVRAAELSPADAEIQALLASVCLSLQRVEEFEQALTRALRINPEHSSALRLLAGLNLQHGRFKDAAKSYFKLLNQDESDVEALLSLGVCFFKTGDRDSAAMMFERVLHLQPGHELARENLQAARGTRPDVASGNTPGPFAASTTQASCEDRQLDLSGYFQPPAGSTEKCIDARPVAVNGPTLSSFQGLKDYDIRDFGTGLDAACAILSHILKTKLNTVWSAKDDFWPKTLVLPIRCELCNADGQTFAETKPASLDELGVKFSSGEAPRRVDIENYARQLRAGVDLGRPLYVTGALLKKLAPTANVEAKAIYMMDGARRITASALAHRGSMDALLIVHEDEYAALLPKETLDGLRQRLAALKWFDRYQSIPLLGVKGERTLKRFDLMSLPMLRDAVVMDFGCNTGQACLKAAQAGARQVIGVEGMPDTFAAAQEIARLSGMSNVRYASVNFNDADFDQQVDAAWSEPVDYAFFFSVYRTKELTQRERLFRYIIAKARKGIFFEGHAAQKIDTLEYYDWLFECFGVKGKFLGYSEGELRPLFYIDLVACRVEKSELNHPHPGPLPQERERGVAVRSSNASCRVLNGIERGDQLAHTACVDRAPSPGGEGRGEGGPELRQPLVSAIVSTYNNERFMEGRLRDLVAQTLGDRLEIIVVDSGSQQNEGAIVKRFMEAHSNIRYIRTEERETIYQAWNRGIRASRGRYITSANTDDRLRPDALEILASELDAQPGMALVYADFFITNTENEDFLSHTRTGYSIKPEFAPNIMLDGCHMGPQPMWRRSLHDDLGWFDESLFAAGDYEFWCRVATKHPMLHVQEFLGLYLHNAAGICNSNSSRTGDETAKVRVKYRGLFPPPAKELPRGFFYREPVKPGRFVNIGMVTFNRLEFTKRSIPALLEHTDFPYALTVVDNASTDGTREYLAALKQLGVIKNLVLLDENVGVAKASNVAWSQEPDAEFYLKLDNDIVIEKPGWLRKMAEVLEAVPKIGAVAYSFEPRSYPAIEAAGQVIRPKPGGTLGGACVMIPKRTERALGCWCEDYGLYGEEDFDYGIRILSKGWINAYMEDEDIGFHLPNGRAAVINDETMDAKDGLEEVVDREYRQFKDGQRREQVLSGKRDRYEKEYRSGQRPLFVTSGFVAQRKPVASRVPDQVPASPEAQRPLRVVVFSLDHPATACAVLRLIAPLSRMSRPCKIVWCAKLTKEGAVVDDSLVKHADVVVIQRMFAGPENEAVLHRIFASGKPILYELDDWFFDMPADNPHTQYAKSRLPYIRQIIQRAQVVTVSTDELRQRMASLHPRVVVLPNLVDEKQWAARAALTGDKVIIGYAGTATHSRDLAMVERVLERIAAKHAGRVGFVFLGCSTERLARLPDSRVVEFQHGYGKYVQTLQSVPMDIALAPLTDNPFNRCKSNIKWVEYSAAGIAGVYADIPAYRDCVQHGETGMLAGASADDWFKAIDELVTNESKRKGIAARARELVMREHSLTARAELWEEVYSQVAGRDGVALEAPQVVVAPKSRTPSVSIVIPTFNNLALTRQCLAALYQNTPAGFAEIIIVDNGSTDGTVPFLEAERNAGRLRAILNAQNLGFARGCNQGALEARGEFVLFLNNDTQTQPGWLDAMLSAARETQAGVVGCKLLYPDGTIQHAGIEFINGVPDHQSRHAAADAPEVNQCREFDMVTGACFLMPKKLFLELGGFDEVFRNGVEDVDLCLRVRAAGRKVVYEPKAVVTHHEGKSQGRFNHVTENLKIFFTRWKGQFDEKNIFRAPKKARVQKSEKSLLVTAVNVCWDGSFLDLGSLSHVNRELTRALSGNAQVQLTRLGKNSVPKPLAGMKSILDCARQLRAQPSKPAQVTVRHAWPPSWDAPVNGAWVLIQPWEFGALPKEWVKNLARVDEVWVPSDYVRRVYVDSGVEPRKVHVVPNGIDPQVFQPDAKPMKLATKKSFKFLFVGGTILRKGPDVLLKAYLESFTAQDDVCLVIKDFGGQSVYAGQTFEAHLKAAQAKPNAPEILYLNDELPPEALPGLYAACDCLVHPYRGEGFGLPVLEAMACGLPVVVTAGGSTDDFATDEFAYRLPSIRKGFGSSVSGMELVKPGWMLEPDHAALVERMKWIASHREEARAKGRAASEHVRREWTWERAAQIAAARLVLLNEHQPAPVVPTAPRKAKPIELPVCGKLGHLGEARELFRAGKLLASWNAVIAALKLRPYHPEGFLLLAEIAQATGDSKQAKELADRARRMAPKWKPAHQFAKAKHSKSAMTRLELPALPKALMGGAREPSLSVFLITKNEERFIGQCLESVRDIASQIVVMDTGSTDWTQSIAERFGAEVHTFDWCDDFSAARNAALEKVTGDWVLMLDADEEFLPDQKEKLRQLMNDPSAIAWRLPMVDKGREDEGLSHVPRLFRNAPGLFYIGRIHEQVFSSVEVRRQEWGLENRFGDAKLLHHGYTKEMVQSRDKIARNLRLLHLAMEELPGEPNLLMNLGLELVRDGRVSEGLEQYAAAFAALSALPKDHVTPELRESLLTQYASHLVSAKRSTEVVRVLQSTLAKAGGLTASMHWLLGLAFIEQKQFAEGAAQMRECLAKRTHAALTPVNRNILKGGPSHCLALCLAALKQRDAADQAFQSALKEDPNARTVRFDYARFLVEGGHEVDALKWLHELAMEDASDLRVWQFCGQVALSKPEYFEFAADWTSEAFKLHSSHPAIIEQRATVLMLSGEADAALTLWRELDSTTNAVHCAALVVCEALAGRSVTPVNGAIAPAVNQEFLNWYRRLLGVNAERLVAVLHQRMDRWRSAAPLAARMIEAAMSEVNVIPSK